MNVGYILTAVSGNVVDKKILDKVSKSGLAKKDDYTCGDVYAVSEDTAYSFARAEVLEKTSTPVRTQAPGDIVYHHIVYGSPIYDKFVILNGIEDYGSVREAIVSIDNGPLSTIAGYKLGKSLISANIDKTLLKKKYVTLEDLKSFVLSIDTLETPHIHLGTDSLRVIDECLSFGFSIKDAYKDIIRKVNVTKYKAIATVQCVKETDRQLRIGILGAKAGEYGSNFGVIFSRPGDDIYDYIDVGRLLLLAPPKESNIYTSILGVFDNNITKGLIDSTELNIEKMQSGCRSKKIEILTNGTVARFKDIEKTKELQKSLIKNKVVERLSSRELKSVKLSGLALSEDSFAYDGIKVTAGVGVVGVYREALSSLAHNLTEQKNQDLAIQEVLNFNTLFDGVITNLSAEFNTWPKRDGDFIVSFAVNKLSVDVKKTVSDKGSSRYTINGVRINHSELSRCISRAICYQTQEDFDEFLRIVSKCSLDVHKFLSGIDVKVKITYDTDLLVKVCFRRKQNKNFLVVANETIAIKNLRGFGKKLERFSAKEFDAYGSKNSLSKFIATFGLTHFNENTLTEEHLVELLKGGKKLFDEALKKSQELLKSAVKITDAAVKTYRYGGKSITGYQVTSVSGVTYLVTDQGSGHSGGCSVYHVMGDGELEYICIVDRSLGDQVGKDKIVNRLFALKNDAKVVGEIHTLEGIVR